MLHIQAGKSPDAPILGLRFSFDNLLGHETTGVSRTDERSLGVLVNVRS